MKLSKIKTREQFNEMGRCSVSKNNQVSRCYERHDKEPVLQNESGCNLVQKYEACSKTNFHLRQNEHSKTRVPIRRVCK